MLREIALKTMLVLVGLLFLAGIYPVTMDLWHANPKATGDDDAHLYFVLGIFLLMAVRNPAANRSLIAFRRGEVSLTLWLCRRSPCSLSKRANAKAF